MADIFDFTKFRVKNPDGTTTAYDNALDAAKAQSRASEGTVPTIGTVSNAMIPEEATPTLPPPIDPNAVPAAVAAPDAGTPGTLAATVDPTAIPAPPPPAPAIADVAEAAPTLSVNPTAVDGTATLRKPTITKGHILEGLLNLAGGAAAGAGSRTFGEGYQKAIMLPIDIQRAHAQAADAQAQADLREADVAQIPANDAAKQKERNARAGELDSLAAQKQLLTPQGRQAYASKNPDVFQSPDQMNAWVLQGDAAFKAENGTNLNQLYSNAVHKVLLNGGDPATDPVVQHYADAITAIQKQPAAKEPNKDDKYISLIAKQASGQPLTPDEQSFRAGYEHFVKVNKVDPGVARTSVLLQYPVQIEDPNNPGHLIYTTRKDAVGQTTGQDAAVTVPKALLRDFTSGPDAHTLTAINTADAHLDQLRGIAAALKNGDIQLVNRLGNAYAAQTGSAAPVNFHLLRTALSGEIGKTVSGGVAHVEEMADIQKALDAANSPDQFEGVLGSAQTLMHSKREQLKNQFEQGMKGQPSFSTTPSATSSAPARPANVPANAVWNPQGHNGAGSWQMPQ